MSNEQNSFDANFNGAPGMNQGINQDINQAPRKQSTLMEKLLESDLLPMPVWVARAVTKVRRWSGGEPEGYSTGFETFDNYFRLIPSEVMIIAGRPSMGKTSLAMQIGENVAEQIREREEQGCVAIFSAEMSGDALLIRSASAQAGVDANALRLGKGTDDDIARLVETLETMRDLPIWTDDGAAPTTEQMMDRVSRLNDIIPVKLIIFDYLELAGDRNAPSEDLRIGRVIMRLKDIAKTLQIPVIVLSQLGRQVEDRPNKLPTISDLRYSGAVEQVADVVLLLMQPWYYIKRGIALADVPVSDQEGIAYVIVGKNRNGSIARLRMRWNDRNQRFEDLTPGATAEQILDRERRDSGQNTSRNADRSRRGYEPTSWLKD